MTITTTTITVSVDEAMLKSATARAAKEGTSVDELCRRAIEGYAKGKIDWIEQYMQFALGTRKWPES